MTHEITVVLSLSELMSLAINQEFATYASNGRRVLLAVDLPAQPDSSADTEIETDAITGEQVIQSSIDTQPAPDARLYPLKQFFRWEPGMVFFCAGHGEVTIERGGRLRDRATGKLFWTPSAAASHFTGTSVNGWLMFSTVAGHTLDEYRRRSELYVATKPNDNRTVYRLREDWQSLLPEMV